MDSKIFGFLVVLALISIIPVANAQISIGEKATQESVEVIISSEGNVHVKHIIRSSNLPQDLELIYGTVSNVSVTNEQNEEVLFSINGDSTMMLIQPSDEGLIIEYDLDHVLVQINNVWTWSFRYLETTSFILPEEVNVIFTNERPVLLDKKKGISCHGCQMVLEYSINEPKIFENVTWEDEEFVVEIQGYSNISNFVFEQPTKSITFDISKENQFVTTIIPLELLWKPYSVFLNNEKVFFHEYINNGTHVWLSMKPETVGEVSIIGTTVIPEFPIIAPLAIGFLMILIIPFTKKFSLH
jgi:hypothetical protein